MATLVLQEQRACVNATTALVPCQCFLVKETKHNLQKALFHYTIINNHFFVFISLNFLGLFFFFFPSCVRVPKDNQGLLVRHNSTHQQAQAGLLFSFLVAEMSAEASCRKKNIWQGIQEYRRPHVARHLKHIVLLSLQSFFDTTMLPSDWMLLNSCSILTVHLAANVRKIQGMGCCVVYILQRLYQWFVAGNEGLLSPQSDGIFFLKEKVIWEWA